MSRTPAEYLPLLNEGDGLTGSHWELIADLVASCPTTVVRDAALEWCASHDPATRSSGLDVLGCLAADDEGLVPALVDEALRAAASVHQTVRWSAAVALQYKDDERVAPLLCLLSADADDDVRWQAVFGLPAVKDVPAEHPVVRALLVAMQDPADAVRDWATFALGTQTDVDTAVVREAFLARLADPDNTTAGEAARALARRKDRRVLSALLVRLDDPDVDPLYVEAAGALGDARALPALQRLLDNGWADGPWAFTWLEDAMEACRAGRLCRAAGPRASRPRSGTGRHVVRDGSSAVAPGLRSWSRMMRH